MSSNLIPNPFTSLIPAHASSCHIINLPRCLIPRIPATLARPNTCLIPVRPSHSSLLMHPLILAFRVSFPPAIQNSRASSLCLY
ncbi:hypothetical protein E2C01_050456 [Portunus trituberculatus]|uniref:Uncharacterized protein n=1 Tax=Portunus trituberculatus TaxID=210409 RepID=A0A5B7GGF8_PORTR|nr:hypothetical protein [Portunus trituberculatus]